METTHSETMPLPEIWTRVFDRARQVIDVPTVWLAMQAVRPLTIDGNFFVATLPPESQYLAINIQGFEATTAIEESLQAVTGRLLAFRLISGQALADWEREKSKEAAAAPSHLETRSSPPPISPSSPKAPPDRTVYPTWEKLSERLVQGYKTAPLYKYPQGQARYILECVRTISDTMDLLMPAPGRPVDEAQERTLAKMLERLGSVINLDPLFLSLELLRYRQRAGKDIGL
jgi:hypothetical protein